MFHGVTPGTEKTLLLMGIVNLTCDSFSGGGFMSAESAVEHALALLNDGADMLDIGAESTRPGSTEIPADEEIKRLTPVVSALLTKHPDLLISVDTRHSRTAEEMLKLGVKIINDVSALRFDSGMKEVLQKYPQSQVILCHSRGTPENMTDSRFSDYGESVVKTICNELLDIAEHSGIAIDRFIFDPGFGFAKTPEQQLQMMHDAAIFTRTLGKVLFGISRKSFIGKATGEDDPVRRSGSTLAGELHLASCGAAILRTHDVKQLRDALTFLNKIQEVKTCC